ncbi:MAG: DUF4332 domain-containing protein [Candidatus Helarchaeota archaeon]|nr:DUF4332 domain-containing protein [Candidatus Helarchaeota archaeon]
MKKSGKILIGLMIVFLLIGAEASHIYHQSAFRNSEPESLSIIGDLFLADIDPPKKPYSLKNLVIELQNVTVDQNDTDGDGLYDSVEAVLGTDFNNIDSDYDNLNDSYEVDLGLDPLNPDTNEDGLPDYHEVTDVYSLDIDGDTQPNIWDFDNDGDGVNDRLDLSPGAKSTSHSSFSFSITTDQKPLFMTFQLRPANPAHLKLVDQSWDWPWDNETTMQDLDNSKEDVIMAPWLRVGANDIPSQASVNEYGVQITSDGMEVALSTNREYGSIVALTGRLFHPTPPASLSLDLELVWKVSGFSDGIAKSLEAQNGMYVTIGDNLMAVANTSVESEGLLNWIELGDNNIALKVFNGPYLSVADNGILFANGTSIGARETFALNYRTGNEANFKAYNSKYLSIRPDGVVVATSNQPVDFTVSDLGYYPEVTPLVTYNDAFLITGLTIEESYGSDVGLFYNSTNKNETIAASMIMDYIFLRNATTTIWDMLTMLSTNNVTVSNRTESFVEKNEAFVDTGNELIPEILRTLPENQTLPIIFANEDNSKTLDLSDIPSGSYIIGKTNSINLAAEPIMTVKSMKMNFYNTSSEKLVTGGFIMIEIDSWGLDENTSLDLKTLIWKWNLGQQIVTKIGGIPTQNFTIFLPEQYEILVCAQKVVFSLDIIGGTFTGLGKPIIEMQASKTAQGLYDFWADLTAKGGRISFGGKKWTEFNYKGAKQSQILKSSKLYKVLKGINIALLIIDVIASLVFYGFAIEHARRTADAYREAIDDAYGDEFLAIQVTLTTIAYYVLIALTISLFASGIGAILALFLGLLLAVFGFFLDSLIGLIVGLIFGSPTDEYHAEPDIEIEGSPESTIVDLDDNGLDVGDRIEILTHLVGIINGAGSNPTLRDPSYIVPWISIAPPSDPYSTTSTRLNESLVDYSPYEWQDHTQLLNRTSSVEVNSTRLEDRYDSMAWIKPGIPMRNFPVKVMLNGEYHIRSIYYHKWLGLFKCWHHKWTDDYTTPFEITTLYYDVLPGTLNSFLGWKGVTLNDRDGDGLNDSIEVSQGVSNKYRYDTDADGLNDKYEIDNGIDPSDCDTDEDGLIDKYEYVYGTNASNRDSDGDGIYDYLEIAGWIISFNYSGQLFQMRVFSNPALNDTDGDGYSDGAEYWSGLNPRSADTNGDGTIDVAVPQTEIIALLKNTTDIAIDIMNSSCTVSEIAVDADGYVYAPVIDSGGNYSILVLDSNLTYYNNWSLPFYPIQVAVDEVNETLYVFYSPSYMDYEIISYYYNGTNASNPITLNFMDIFPDCIGMDVDSSGYLYLAYTAIIGESPAAGIRKYAPDGTLLATYGSYGIAPDQFTELKDVAVDELYGYIYALDGDRVMRLNETDGSFITTIPNGYGLIVDFAVDADGWIYVLDQFDPELGEGCVRRFDHNGMEDRNFILTDTNSTPPWELIHYPLRIDIDSEKNVYILENKIPTNPNPKIMKFRPNVTLIPPNITNDKYDWDGDGLWNLFEVVGWNTTFVNNGSVTTLAVNSEPLLRDTDLDGLTDYYENLSRSNPRDTDTDGDGLSDFFEWELGTNLTDDDTDGDGLSDSNEVLIGSNPINSSDTDADGLSDLWEFLLNSNPTKIDTDDDGANDSQEFLGNSSLLDPDTDDDLMFDGLEYLLGCDPNDQDTDDDDLLDGEELIYNTDPTLNDTDGDGLIDGLEVDLWLNPLDPDTDEDGLSDWIELYWGSNPMNNDTDADGVPDGLDNDILLTFTTPMYVAFDPDPNNSSLKFAQNLGIAGNVTIVSVEDLLANHTNSSLIVLVGHPAPENDTVGGLIYNLLADTGTVLSEMMAPDSYKMVIRHGVWTSTQTVIMLSKAYPLDGYKVFSSIKTKNVTILPNSVFIEYTTTPMFHNQTDYGYGFQLDDLDVVKTTDSIVSIEFKNWTLPSIQITKYTGSTTPYSLTRHNGLNVGENALGKYLNVTLIINGSITDTVDSALIQIYYRLSDLDRNGNGVADDPFDIDETTLAFYWYDETTGSWIKLTEDLDWVLEVGINTTDVELYGESYAGFIWARVTHLSTYGVGGLTLGIPPIVFPLVLLFTVISLGLAMYLLEYRRAKLAARAAKKKEKIKVKTKTPEKAQIGAIEDIEGIGPQYAKLLKQMGINTTEDLRKISFIKIAEATDISTKLLYKWQCIADLFRVRRAAEEYTEFLFEMGIHTIQELSEQNVADLHKKVRAFAEEVAKKPSWRGKVKKAPTQRDVETWIASAKELIKKGAK